MTKNRIRKAIANILAPLALATSSLSLEALISSSDAKEKPTAVLAYNSKYPAFLEEVEQYKKNYSDRFNFRVYPVWGLDTVSSMIYDVNSLIEQGTEVTRVNYFDHTGPIMLGLNLEEWSHLPGISRQNLTRETIIGTCFGGITRKPIIYEMARVAGSDFFTGTTTSFMGVTRYPVKDDTLGLIAVTPIKESTQYFVTQQELLDSLPKEVSPEMEKKLKEFNPNIGTSYMVPYTNVRYYVKSLGEWPGLLLEVVRYEQSNKPESKIKVPIDLIPAQN